MAEEKKQRLSCICGGLTKSENEHVMGISSNMLSQRSGFAKGLFGECFGMYE